MGGTSSLLLSVFGLALVPTRAQSISATEAEKHIGQRSTVCGTVTGEHTATSSRGEPTFVNLDGRYPNQIFTLLIWGEDRPSVGTLPADGSHVCATGVIQEYRGLPEIVVLSAAQLSRSAPTGAAATPSGATARCRDGSYSYSQHRQGTCSHHGGVAEWLQ
jgi:hypothetical protein